MYVVGHHRSARTFGLALVAGFIVFEAALALRTGAVGIPGAFLVRLTDGSVGMQGRRPAEKPDGGESVIAKLPEVAAAPELAPEKPREPATLSAGEPRLDGLAEIPLKPWDGDDSQTAAPQGRATASRAREKLPWDAVEPVPLDSGTGAAAQDLPAVPQTQPALPLEALPAGSDVAAWVKAKATKVKGEDRVRPFYHLEFWLEPPQEVARRLVAVAYEFNTPAVLPQSQVSSEEGTGFRVSAGGLTCADKVTVTLRFKDGRSERVEVDGCKLLG